ncbi:MAG TPA: hypothetical protein VM098_01535 [Phycisphaerae bacterium]|nr:hypothetical protein [Phycisphaerae bacterium]
MLVLVGLAAALVAADAEPAAPVAIYTKDNAPAAPKLEDLPLKESVSQYGITWTFEKPARVGQFVSGDWYVVGPVTVKEIDPKPLFGKEVPAADAAPRELRKMGEEKLARNGSLLNPPPRQEVSFDSEVANYYNPELFARLPIAMKPGDCLVSSISVKKGAKARGTYAAYASRDNNAYRPVVAQAILTCLAEPQPPDAFRPSYCDRQQKVYLARNLRRELLPTLPRVPSATADALANSCRTFQRPWFNTGFFSFDQACKNMPNYAQLIAQACSDAGCLLCLDFRPEEKEPLVLGLVQVGIDLYGVVRAGHPGWQAWGGHGSGRKFPIVFAGLLLGDDAMARVTKTLPKACFGEDEQTAYGDSWTGAKVVFTGHSGISAATGLSHADVSRRAAWGPYEHRPPSQWIHGNFTSDGYRRANTTRAWVGEALAMRLMKGEKYWGHDAFFDYVDRWMAEGPGDMKFLKAMAPYCTFKNAKDTTKWARSGVADGPVVREMYKKYRSTCAAAMDGWKQPHDDSYYKNAVKDMERKMAARKPAPSAGKTDAK